MKIKRITKTVENFVFAESCVPPLNSGEYRLTVTQHSKNLGDSEPVTQRLFVEGPRFSLRQEDICSVYPPDKMTGSFGQSLPHIVFNRKTLPWERLTDKQLKESNGVAPSMKTPWMALLLLSGDEIQDIYQDTVENAIKPSAESKAYFPHLNIRKEEGTEMCEYIDLPGSDFEAVFPAYEDLVYLCHARQTNAFLKSDTLDHGEENPWRSVLIGARLPEASEDGAKNRAYVVSLEGFDHYSENPPGKGFDTVRLIVLHHWDFYAATFPWHFKEICSNLTTGPLCLPESPNQRIEPYIKNGYVPMLHSLRDGGRTVSLYRGPLTPVQSQNEDLPPADAADALYQYDPSLGVFDVSLANAWQIGRLVTLNNRSVAMKIMGFREKNRRSLHRIKLHGQLRDHFTEGAEASTPGQSVLRFLNQQLEKIL